MQLLSIDNTKAKNVIIMGDFNNNLLWADDNRGTSNFYGLSTHSLLRTKIIPARITDHFLALIVTISTNADDHAEHHISDH